MAFDGHANFAVGTVLTAPSPATSGTSLVLGSGQGALMPAVPFNATMAPPSVLATALNSEIVRVTAISGDTPTIVRAQEGSTAQSIGVGWTFAATITRKMITDLEQLPFGLQVNSRLTWIRTQNAYQLRHFLGLIPQAVPGSGSVPIKILVDGDSIEEGTGTASIHERWINRFKDQVSAAVGCDGGSLGYIPALYSGVVGNPAWQTTLVSGDAGTLQGDGIGGRSWLSASGTTNQRTWTSVPCDRLAVLYNKGSARGKIEVRIDNVLVASFDTWQSGAGPTAAIWNSVTDGAITITPGVHTIKLTTVNTGTGATFQCSVAGIFPYWQNHDAGVQLWDGAHAAFPSQAFSTIQQAHIALIDPDLVLHCKGVNDSAFGGTPATLAGTLASNVATLNGLGIGDVSHAFFAAWGNAGSQTPSQWLPYHDAIFNAAIGVAAFADQGDSLGWPATDATSISDSVAHPNAAGGEITASVVADALQIPPAGRNRTAGRFMLPSRGSFGWLESGGFPIVGIRRGGSSVDEVYLTCLGGLGAGDGQGNDELFLLNAGAWDTTLTNTPIRSTILSIPVTKTASWTWALAEGGKRILANPPSGNITGTIPPSSSVAFPVGTILRVTNQSTHTITIVAGAGVTINNPSTVNLALTQTNDIIELENIGTDVWQVNLATDLVLYSLLNDGRYGPLKGWISDNQTWKWGSATSFTIPGDATAYLGVGDKVSVNDGTVKYAQISSITNSGESATGVASTIGTSLFTKTAHGLGAFVPVTIAGLVNTTGVTNGAVYWPVNITANTFQLSDVVVGTPITLGGAADGAIVISTATAVSVVAQGDSSFTNAVLTAPRYSYAAQPYGFPGDAGWARSGTATALAIGTWTFVAPSLGAATATSLAATGKVSSSSATAGVGYATGAGGTVTQGTSRTTGVTLNHVCGAITLFTATLAADTDVSFTLTNSAIAATDVLVMNVISGAAVKGGYHLNAQCAAGSAVITVHNLTPTITASEAPVIQFVVVKAVNA